MSLHLIKFASSLLKFAAFSLNFGLFILGVISLTIRHNCGKHVIVAVNKPFISLMVVDVGFLIRSFVPTMSVTLVLFVWYAEYEAELH